MNFSSARTFYSIHRQYPFSDDNQEFTVAYPNLRRLENLFEYSKLWNDAQDNSTPYGITKKRAKAIIKGDPREFMG